jgi:hypothetical protein
MPRTLDPAKAEKVTRVVRRLGKAASFRNVWTEVAREGILKHHRTLRAYLDLLIRGGVLTVRKHDVGSVYSQEIYQLKSKRPKVWVGLSILQTHGLNWDVPEIDKRVISTDFSGLVRSKLYDHSLMASLEDCLVNEVYIDTKNKTGTVTFVGAIISTRRVDLAYLLTRADEMHLGKAFRLLFKRMLEIVSSNKTDLDASIFLAIRERYLMIVRQYVQSGFWKLVDERASGVIGLGIVQNLREGDLILAAAKQLGVIG